MIETPSPKKLNFGFRPQPSIDCKTVGFFLKISKEIEKAWRNSLTRASRASLTPVGRVRREKKILASLSSLALCFQPRSRPFV